MQCAAACGAGEPQVVPDERQPERGAAQPHRRGQPERPAVTRIRVPAFSLLTHTSRPCAATPYAPPLLARVREVTLRSSASIRDRDPSRLFATQAAPSPTAIPTGPLPTGTAGESTT